MPDTNKEKGDDVLKLMLKTKPKPKESKKAIHMSDCAVNNAPAMKPGRCDCGAIKDDPVLHDDK